MHGFGRRQTASIIIYPPNTMSELEADCIPDLDMAEENHNNIDLY